MSERLLPILAFLSALGAGLTTGTWFAFSVFVMAGLARIPAAQGIAAMQSINITVINPLFMAAFLGTGILSLAVATMAFLNWGQGGRLLLIAAAVLYLVGVLGVTMAFNVPLNDALAAVEPASTEGAQLWSRYLSVWLAWNHVRAVAGLASFAAFVLALSLSWL
jgi:uncharacterized membrane protein